MGNRLDWAEREVAIAMAREAKEDKEGDSASYAYFCYQSALKAYESLIEDNHSGMSWGFTEGILMRLIENKPITPIYDVPEVWDDTTTDEERFGKSYQCNRMSSLFKIVGKDGKVVYQDVSRTSVFYPNSDAAYHNGTASRLIDEMFPITMPYWPPMEPFKVEASQYLTDRKNGDFDTIAFRKVTTPYGVVKDINRFFGETEDGWKELTHDEFMKRVQLHNKRAFSEWFDA